MAWMTSFSASFSTFSAGLPAAMAVGRLKRTVVTPALWVRVRCRGHKPSKPGSRLLTWLTYQPLQNTRVVIPSSLLRL